MVALVRGLSVLLSLSIGLGGASGCSILFTKGPPTRVEPHEPIRCTKSYAAPVVDGLITVLHVARTLYAVSLTDRDYQGMQLTREADIAFGVGLSGLFLISTAVGSSRVGGCNELLEKVERRPEARRPRPARPFAPPPPAGPDPDADEERAESAAAADAKAAGDAAAASQSKPEVIVAPAK